MLLAGGSVQNEKAKVGQNMVVIVQVFGKKESSKYLSEGFKHKRP
jgi:hypothetical protein